MSRRGSIINMFLVVLTDFPLLVFRDIVLEEALGLASSRPLINTIVDTVIVGLAVAIVYAARYFGKKRNSTQRPVKEQLLSAVFEHSPSLIYVKDADSRILMGNQRYQEFHKISARNAR